MAVHPTFTHAAADLRRQALIREAAIYGQQDGKPARSVLRRATHACWVIGTRLAWAIGLIVDSFEPLPRHPAGAVTVKQEGRP